MKTPPPQSTGPQKKNKQKRRVFIWVIVVLVTVRIALPYILLYVANDRLAKIPGYHGHIADLDLAIYRGAYRLDDFYLNKVDSATGEATPFLGAGLIDLSVEWRSLFHGELVGELEIDRPLVRFTLEKAEPTDVAKDTASLGDVLNDFMPLRINRLELRDGRIEYSDPTSSPPVELALTKLEAVANNLTSVVDEEELLPSTVTATADVYQGKFDLKIALDPLSEQTIFDLDLKVLGVSLPELNSFFKAYGKFDVNKGSMDLYAEIATRDGAFSGYVKPVIKDLDVLGKEDKKDGFLHKLYEGIVGTAGVLLKNQREDQIATKLPFEGKLDSPNARTWVAVVELLRNAFIRALEPVIDRDINIDTPIIQAEKEERPGLLKRVFGKKDEKRD